jgi:hypothetical protein
MKRRTPRAIGIWSAVLIAWALWWLAFAWPGPDTPWSARSERPLPLASMAGASARVSPDDAGIRIEGVAPGRSVDVATPVEAFDAGAFRSLRYVAHGLTASRKLLLTWDGDAGRGFVTLAPALGARGMLDLGRVPSWKGRIERIGFAIVPIDYVPSAALPAPDVTIREAVLASASWRDATAMLWYEWSAARAWTGRSNNTAGFDFVGTRAPSLPGFVAGGFAITFLLLWLLAGRERAARLALPLVFGAGLLLSLEQVRQHLARSSSVIDASRAVATLDGEVLSAHPPLQTEARALLTRMQDEDLRARIFVHGAAGFFGDYPVWLLREQDAGGLLSSQQLPTQEQLAGTLLVLVGSGHWSFDPQRSELRLGSIVRRAEPYFEGTRMRAYRFPSPGGAAP